LTDEDTYGSVYDYDYPEDPDWTFEQRKIQMAIDSREQVLKNGKFQEIFKEYIDAIGINKKPDNNEFEWDEFLADRAVIKARKEEEQAKKEKLAAE
jgi:hypothetical protein